MWISGFALALTLASGDPSVDAARQELSRIAVRIEQLKAEHLEGRDNGRELYRLLVRAQELAGQIDRRSAETPPPPAVAPSLEELRERADALHDEADRLAGALTDLDVRIAALRRATAPSAGKPVSATVRHAAVGPAPRPFGAGQGSSLDLERLHRLLVERDALAARLAHVRAEAAHVESEAAAQAAEP